MKANVSIAVFISIIGLGITYKIISMCYTYPLFDFAVTNIDWTREWLYATVGKLFISPFVIQIFNVYF